ncbi:MAG: hypothetical protein D6721_02945 [Gammaproteobacteria bacterium]|nr:MAG: hypothetical protein D6721_02945 [Gammaproteobacteria bacterium]
MHLTTACRLALLPAAVAMAIRPAMADPSEDLARIRQEIAALKKDYDARLRVLEKRLEAAEARARQAENEARAARRQAVQPATTSQESTNAFNPAIGLVLNARYRSFSRSAAETAISGFPLGEEATKGEEGFSLGESELGLSANIDDKFYGQFTGSFVSDGGGDHVEIEEAFIQTLDLPGGLGLKAGRFLPGIGYLNSAHTHTDDFADRPLPYRVFLNTAYKDDGVELRWLAPTDLFLEAGADLLSGDHYPAAGHTHAGVGAWAAFVHVGGDWDESNSWQVGISHLHAEARGRTTGDPANPDRFTGHDRLWILDGIWKWAPNGNPYRHNFKLQGEWFRRRESGRFTPGGGTATPYSGDQDGWYVQGVYQFMPRWRAGLRLSALSAEDPGPAFSGTSLDPAGHDPRHYSVMVDWSNSEFSRLRLQYNRDQSRPAADDQWTLQYIMSLGAHGAHQF